METLIGCVDWDVYWFRFLSQTVFWHLSHSLVSYIFLPYLTNSFPTTSGRRSKLIEMDKEWGKCSFIGQMSKGEAGTDFSELKTLLQHLARPCEEWTTKLG
jgi:hypothetical protein